MVNVHSRRLGRAGVISAGTVAFVLSGGAAALADESESRVGGATRDVREAAGDTLGGTASDLADRSLRKRSADRNHENPRPAEEPSKEPLQITEDVRRTADKVTDLTAPDDPAPGPDDGREGSADPGGDRHAGGTHGDRRTAATEAGGSTGSPPAGDPSAAETTGRAAPSSGLISLPALDAAPALGPLRLLSDTPSLGDWSGPLPLPRLAAPSGPHGPPPPPQLAPPRDQTRSNDATQALAGGQQPPPAPLVAAAAAVGVVTAGHIGLARVRRSAGA